MNDHMVARLMRLTPLEREVVRQVLDGRLNSQIAAALGVTTRRVELHRLAIRRKLGIRSVVQLAVLAPEARIPERPPALTAEEQSSYRSLDGGRP